MKSASKKFALGFLGNSRMGSYETALPMATWAPTFFGAAIMPTVTLLAFPPPNLGDPLYITNFGSGIAGDYTGQTWEYATLEAGPWTTISGETAVYLLLPGATLNKIVRAQVAYTTYPGGEPTVTYYPSNIIGPIQA